MIKLLDSMLLAGRCCNHWLDPDHDDLPMNGWEVAHDAGRWWDVVLRLEAVSDFEIPGHLEEAMLRNIKLMMDNPDGLLINSPAFDYLKVQITVHNFREAFIALNALVRWRDSDWAREKGHQLLATLDHILDDEGYLGLTKLKSWGKIPLRVPMKGTLDVASGQTRKPGEWMDTTESTGRALEGIIWFYEVTDNPLALKVAERLAQHHLENSTSSDGSVRAEILDPKNIGHCHSYLGTMRGLLLYGLLKGDRHVIDRVHKTYRVGFPASIISESGITPHDLGMTRYPDNDGDPASEPAGCGDAAQIALWLARGDRHPELLDDVERWMRARILPSQNSNPDEPMPGVDGGAEGDRHFYKTLGGWGSYVPPYSRGGCILDILAAVLHSEIDIYNNIFSDNGDFLTINLYFDYEGPECSLAVERADEAKVTCRTKNGKDLKLRIPGWAPRGSIRVTIDGQPGSFSENGHYIKVQDSAGKQVVMTHALQERTTKEVMPISKNEYTLTWKADTPINVEPYEDQYYLYK